MKIAGIAVLLLADAVFASPVIQKEQSGQAGLPQSLATVKCLTDAPNNQKELLSGQFSMFKRPRRHL
jgi:hypothetical protein